MKITSRPSMHPNKGYENVVSDGCPHEVDRVRFEKTSDLSDRESPVVVFRCYGKPGTTHNSNVPYRFSVELDVAELVTGLASIPAELLQTAVVTTLKNAESLRVDDVLEEGQTRRDCGCATPGELASSINAMTSGVVDFLVGKLSQVVSKS